jgi:hypothetical protein
VSKYAEWTPKEIIERGRHLLHFLVEHWNIDKNLLTEENVNKILNIQPTLNMTVATIGVQPSSIDIDDDDDIADEEIVV